MNADPGRHALHLGVAEAGKVHALAHRHDEALRHYREALRVAVSAGAPEVFFRHYTQCVLESLELMGEHEEVIRFCEAADAHYEQVGHAVPLQRRDHAALLERLGANRLKAGDAEGAGEALRRAVELAGSGAQPLAEQLLGWLARHLEAGTERITAAQRRSGYFTVRPDQVDPDRARPLEAGQGEAARMPFGRASPGGRRP
ncbi:MAG: hypothetical protein V2J24_16320 [Pseudomonadales bacterium]|nr:hypothetical protein [Pseudomonadales bacterium]